MLTIDMKLFGAYINELRAAKGLTQKELAAQLHVSEKVVWEWENGLQLPESSLLIPLAKCLNSMVCELLLCRPLKADETMTLAQSDDLLKTVIELCIRERN